MNLLLDTNVVIDYMGRKAPYYQDAEKVVAAGFFGDVKLWTCASSMKDAYYVLSKYVTPKRVQKAIIELCEVISLVSLTEADVIRAAHLEWDDLEDCLIALSAEKAKADYLLTRDKMGFERSSVPVMDPKSWLDMMHEDHGLVYDSAKI